MGLRSRAPIKKSLQLIGLLVIRSSGIFTVRIFINDLRYHLPTKVRCPVICLPCVNFLFLRRRCRRCGVVHERVEDGRPQAGGQRGLAGEAAAAAAALGVLPLVLLLQVRLPDQEGAEGADLGLDLLLRVPVYTKLLLEKRKTVIYNYIENLT